MNTKIAPKTSRILLPLAAAAAIIGGALVSTLGTPDHADAALKWSEHVVKWQVKEEKCHKNDPCADTTTTTDTTTTHTTTTP